LSRVMAEDTFPRQYARTQRLTLGAPRDVRVSPDGKRVIFARSRAGDDPVNCLWIVDLATGEERMVADPVELLAELDAADRELPAAERALRERAREAASGVTSYALDRQATVATFALSGELFLADLIARRARHVPVEG